MLRYCIISYSVLFVADICQSPNQNCYLLKIILQQKKYHPICSSMRELINWSSVYQLKINDYNEKYIKEYMLEIFN